MAKPKMADYKAHKKHKSYLLRDLGDNGVPQSHWVEVIREDGYSFGAMLDHLADAVIEADKKNPRAKTGYTLADLLGE